MIICVEDEQNICELEVYTLQSVGMEAEGCASGKELFALLEQHIPELIVLDIMLPDEDGMSILARLRADKRYASIPVIMATAKGSEYDKVKGLDSGADDYIAKPFGMLEMVARIKAVLRREFSANVSHELKTPLQSVLGYSEIMLSGLVKPEDTKRFLQKINDEAHNLLRLIDDIIKLSKLDELRHDMLEEFVLQDVARSALARLKDKAEGLGVELVLEDNSSGELKLLGIPSLMEEIFFNLLDNGLKYNHKGGSVTLRLGETASKLTVSVIDTGIGIAANELPHIFERFYRVDRSRHKAIDGTGLGLSIVKHGVLFHGGTIRVLSSAGKGSEFIMKFPREGVTDSSQPLTKI